MVCAIQVLIGFSGKDVALSVPHVNCSSEVRVALSHWCSSKREALCVCSKWISFRCIGEKAEE